MKICNLLLVLVAVFMVFSAVQDESTLEYNYDGDDGTQSKGDFDEDCLTYLDYLRDMDMESPTDSGTGDLAYICESGPDIESDSESSVDSETELHGTQVDGGVY
ncbi:hypothetical protein MLD38_034239 [Melastoma candidum]|uniref:Uncharacterized protein n=1 Tax=Melastoma candidum TaxID=119954 RepID=A0ACB9MBM3_9MYRT|nr:hypothetical protein MLD38_034239 [Melastoma candidum]